MTLRLLKNGNVDCVPADSKMDFYFSLYLCNCETRSLVPKEILCAAVWRKLLHFSAGEAVKFLFLGLMKARVCWRTLCWGNDPEE